MDEKQSRRTKIICRSLRITSAAKESPGRSTGVLVCATDSRGIIFKELRVKQFSVKVSITVSDEKEKKYRLNSFFNWPAVGWCSLIWIAATKPLETVRGMTISSLEYQKGFSRFTTKSPSALIEAERNRNRSSFRWVSFLPGREPCSKWEKTLRNTGHDFWIPFHAGRFRNGIVPGDFRISSTL